MLMTLGSRAKLNNGAEIPYLGLGVYQTPPGEATMRAVSYALKIGYRHIDTAELYGNEADVGRALLASGIEREENLYYYEVLEGNQGYNSTKRACQASLRRLGLSYVDLYIIHWPIQGTGSNTWRAMTELLKEGNVRAIGVSNYSIEDLKDILETSDIVLAVNQVEFHPFFYQKDFLQFCNKNKIHLESYSPLTRGKRLNHPDIIRIGKKPVRLQRRF